MAVGRRRSFRAAATEVGLSTTALSQAVAELEGRLGVRLFNRTTRSVSPTEAGEQFLAEVAPALGTIRDAMDAVNTHRATTAGVLRLNTSPGAARRLLQPLLFKFLDRHPQMSVDLVTEGRLVDIVRDGFDAGFRLAEQVPQDMIAVPLGRTERQVVVAAPSYLAEHKPPSTPDDLTRHACIRMRLASGVLYRWEFEKDGEQVAVAVSGRLTLDDSLLIRDAALAGFGLAYISEWDAAEALAAGQLVRLMEDWTPAYPGLCLYYPGHRYVQAGLRALIQLIRESAL